MTAAGARAPGLRYGEPEGRWVLLATVLGSGMAFLDATVVSIALPAIGEDLGSSAAGLQWVVNGYTLTLAAFILLGGSLGDRFGRKRVFLAGVVLFAVASTLCGLAPNTGTLVAARAVQGLGGALLAPGSLAILQSSFAAEDRTRAIGAWSGLSGMAGAIGPLLGGWLVEVANWRLVFLINVPVALVVVLVTLRHVPESSDPAAARRLDVPGTVLAAVGLGGLTYGLTAWQEGQRGVVAATLALGVVALGAFLAVERRSPAPMLPLHLFRSTTFSAVNAMTFLVYAALGGVFFFVVVQLQVVSGFPPLEAGLALLPVTLLMLVLSARVGALSNRIGPRLPMALGPLLCALALVGLSRIGAGADYLTDVLPPVALLGLGLSLTVAPLTATVLAAVEDRYAGVASGINNAVARTGGLLAVAVLPLVSGVGAELTDPATLAPAYRTSMLICAALMAVGGLLALAAVPSSYEQVRPPTERGAAESPCRVHCAVGAPPLQPGGEPSRP
ncbi:MFS transporter [Geodermatophilus ruber]|uniref:Drug resistance transporter, EmrB/QacA subfamily n=1 Tax=Geodermatophilus ruber TaxID=504800 RepID=A0A1I4HVL3_9ACTN|nr:MFS transporter [Geodermatophilus ruber]SFL45671.1 drug resistance transporter, EmrB/QacA subfamily [Geodermatophilus ruber]